MKSKNLAISLVFLGLAGGIWHYSKHTEKPETQPQPTATSPVKKSKPAQRTASINNIVEFTVLASFADESNFNPSTVQTKTNESN